MPKLKTKSAAKKRFSFTATGKVKATQANHAHKMRNKTKSGNRRQQGTTMLDEADCARVVKWMPNG